MAAWTQAWGQDAPLTTLITRRGILSQWSLSYIPIAISVYTHPHSLML